MKIQKNRKAKIVALALTLTILTIFLAPALVLAAAPSPGIVPTTCDGPDCGFEDLLLLAKNIMNFLIAVSIPLAAIAFAYAGFLMLTAAGSESQVSKAREIFTKVLIGFAFVLCAWLIVWTITTTMLCNSSNSSECGFYNLLGN